jgi:hypothetical protein
MTYSQLASLLALCAGVLLGSSGCGGSSPPTISYDSCSGTPFDTSGSCSDGSCATADLDKRVLAAWQARTKALSQLSDADYASRVRVASVTHEAGGGGVWVRIESVVVVDWVESRQADGALLAEDALTNPPTDAQIADAVSLGLREVVWTGLGAVKTVIEPAAMADALDACFSGMSADLCHLDFRNGAGALTAKGNAVIDLSSNQCKEAEVNLATGETVKCADIPCAVE